MFNASMADSCESSDTMKCVGVILKVFAFDAFFVHLVDFNNARSMQDLLVFENDSNMSDFVFLIIKES